MEGDSRKKAYKNQSRTSDEMRRRREEDGIQLRKQKREEQLSKRRNISTADAADSEEEMSVLSPKSNREGGKMVAMFSTLRNGDLAEQIRATKYFRKYLSRNNKDAIDVVLKTVPVTSQLTEFLDASVPAVLQYEAAWALTNIASGTHEQTSAVIEAGGIPKLVNLLMTSTETTVLEQVVWALGNIAGDTPECRDLVLNFGVLPPLLNLIKNTHDPVRLRNLVWTLSNLCKGKNKELSAIGAILPVLAQILMHHTDKELITDTCWAIASLADGPNQRIQAVIDSGVCPKLVEILMCNDDRMVASALRALGNIVTGDDRQTQYVLDCCALPHISKLLNSPKQSICKEACWTLSNIAAGNQAQIQALVKADVIPRVIELMTKGDYKTRKEALWVVNNIITGGTAEHVRYLVNWNCIPAICQILTVYDSHLIHVALIALEGILKSGRKILLNGNYYANLIEECGGLEKIDHLQSHENEDVYRKCYDLLEKYFREDSIEQPDFEQPPSFENATIPAGGFNF